ncbi:MAG TPA: hypothetical protein PKA53_07105 [Sphingobacterium sp.]|nr:hypothetical protein [Sphingobacterium sp.]
MGRKKLKFEELQLCSSIEKITETDLNNLNGGSWYGGSGGGVSWDCVFNVFDYLDGSYFSNDYYNLMSSTHLYYSASYNGGINPWDIPSVGGFGYMGVVEVQSSILNGFDNVTGKTAGGNTLTVLIPGALPGTTHMVIFTQVRTQDGHKVIDYYDPTLGQHSVTSVPYIEAGYEVGSVGSYTTPWWNQGSGPGSMGGGSGS